jgi:hypothetical protein
MAENRNPAAAGDSDGARQRYFPGKGRSCRNRPSRLSRQYLHEQLIGDAISVASLPPEHPWYILYTKAR